MKMPAFICAFLLCTSLGWAQSSAFPDLSDFTRSPTEHIINQVDEPFQVRSVAGTITLPHGGHAAVLIEIEGPTPARTIRRAETDALGRFRIAHVPDGTYRFKATLNGFQSVVGAIIVSRRTNKPSVIKIEMRLGV
jgi:carboxypeptidase family protein